MTTTLEEQVQAWLNPCAANGAWYQLPPDSTPAPYVIWMPVFSSTNNTFDGASDYQNTRMQVDVFAATLPDLIAVQKSIFSTMGNQPFSCLQISSHDAYESPVKLFRRVFDFSIWSKS